MSDVRLDKFSPTIIRQMFHEDYVGRLYPNEAIADYFTKFKSRPSVRWPLSYLNAAKTKKFLEWFYDNNITFTAAFTRPEGRCYCSRDVICGRRK